MPGSCARVPFIALEEIGVPYRLHVLNRYRGENQAPEYRAVNPKGKVPVIVVDGWTITENPVILSTLARTFPDAGLLPTGDCRVEVDARSTMVWFASEMHPAVARQRNPQSVSGDESSWEGIRLSARRVLDAGFTILEERLADTEWLFGDWSIVDAYMFWLWFRAVGSGMDPAPFQRCVDHARRVEARPSVATVLDREEAEFARFDRQGDVPAGLPSYQVGRLPAELVASEGSS